MRRPPATNSCCSGGRGVPLRHGGRSEGSHGVAGNEVTLDVEGIVDGRVGGNEPLGLPLGLEPLHFPLSSSDGQVGIFNPVVVAQSAGLVEMLATQDLHRRTVRSQSIGHDLLGHEASVLEQFPEQFQRGGLVPALLDEHVENLTFLVDSPPHEHPLAVDPDHHLVEMPDIVGATTSTADVRSNGRTELVGPAAHRFIADIDPAFGEHVLDVAQAGGEAEVEPDRQPDCCNRESVAFIGNGFHRHSLAETGDF